MYNQQKLYVLVICLSVWVVLVAADTKVLRNVSINFDRTLRIESISLDKDDNLLVEGTFIQRYPILNDPNHVLKYDIIYIADKDGYRTKYVLEKVDFQEVHRLSPSTLKSSSG